MKKTLTTLATALCMAGMSNLAQAQEITWSKDIKAVFDKNCAACHDAATPEYAQFKKEKDIWLKKGLGMRMETYSHLASFVGWPNTGALMRRLDDGSAKADKKPGNMYQYLGATETERKANLALFKGWVGAWNFKRFNELTKEELSTIKVAY